jgi:hypothetical protein
MAKKKKKKIKGFRPWGWPNHPRGPKLFNFFFPVMGWPDHPHPNHPWEWFGHPRPVMGVAQPPSSFSFFMFNDFFLIL